MSARKKVLVALCLAMLLSGCGSDTTGSDPPTPPEEVSNSANVEPSETSSAAEPSDSASEEPGDSDAEEPDATPSEESVTADDEPHYTISGYGPNDEPLELVQQDITVQNITETFTTEGPVTDWFMTFTRDTEARTFPDMNVYILPKGGRIVVDGLRTSNPYDYASIRAWSDPDGDGIFTQQLFVTTGGGGLPATTLEQGPFEFRYDDTNEHGYMTNPFLYVLRDGAALQLQEPSSVEVSTELLTEFFGPNTICEIEIGTSGAYEGGYGSYGQVYYMYYIPAE